MKNIFIAVLLLLGIGLSAQQPNDIYHKDGRHTYVTRYFEDGSVMEKGTFTGEKADGKWMQYNMDGSIQMEGYYSNGSKEGTWYVYSSCGNYLYEVEYENNLIKNSNRWKIEERNLLASE